MIARVKELIEEFGLIQHPEGGWYSETYRSEEKHGERSLMTSIYFLLTNDNPSNFHRIKSDEHWYFHEGDALTVHTLDSTGHQEMVLGLDLKKGERPYHLVKANTIFGSSVDTKNGYALVSCAVAPGFDFRDFELFEREELLKDYKEFSEIICKLTSS